MFNLIRRLFGDEPVALGLVYPTRMDTWMHAAAKYGLPIDDPETIKARIGFGISPLYNREFKVQKKPTAYEYEVIGTVLRKRFAKL